MYVLQVVIFEQMIADILARSPSSEPKISCRLQLLFIHNLYGACMVTINKFVPLIIMGVLFIRLERRAKQMNKRSSVVCVHWHSLETHQSPCNLQTENDTDLKLTLINFCQQIVEHSRSSYMYMYMQHPGN